MGSWLDASDGDDDQSGFDFDELAVRRTTPTSPEMGVGRVWYNPAASRSNRRRWSEEKMPSSPQQVTELLLAWSQGDESALERLIPLVHGELRRLARRYMARERAAHTLQTTALINEAYLRLINSRNVRWQNRAHFFAVSAQLMRRILVDFARSRKYQKRGGQARKVSLDEAMEVSVERDADLIELDDALSALAQVDPRKSQVVELRFFGGLGVEETAEVLKISPDTVMRDWKMAKVWLLREMSGERKG